MGRPPLLVGDEPTSALDADLRVSFLRLLSQECREAGSALLFVSHDRSLAGELDRAVEFSELSSSWPLPGEAAGARPGDV